MGPAVSRIRARHGEQRASQSESSFPTPAVPASADCDLDHGGYLPASARWPARCHRRFQEMHAVARIVVIAILAAVGTACGGGGGDGSHGALLAHGQELAVAEDSRLDGILRATVPASKPVSFVLVSGPARGSLELDATTGRFSYLPEADYFGSDSFAFKAQTADGVSGPASIQISIRNVDDAPRLAEIADVGNSASSAAVRIPLQVVEPDGEPVSIIATASDPSVVHVSVDPAGAAILLEGREYGEAVISIQVRDAVNTVSGQFAFSVRDVTRSARVASASPEHEAIVISNGRPVETRFELLHNGQIAFTRIDQIIEAVRALSDDVEDEPFERKLWRYVRDAVYHAPPVNAEQWLYASWPTMASFGWGFCGHVAAIYVRVARAAGYEARVWGLNGHVVPEIYVDGAWRMYDPDLAVYYRRRDGAIAGVEDLVADPLLIRSPVNPLFNPGGNDWAYSDTVAAIYGSADDNRLADHVFLSLEEFRGSTITLPADARLVYPGHWTPAPIGYDGSEPYPIEAFRQARMELPAGFLGNLSPPWVLWDVQGTGRVKVMDRVFDAGSAELAAFLQAPGASVTSVDVVENDAGLALVFMVNALWYRVEVDNEVELTGKDVWGLRVQMTTLAPEHRLNVPPPESLMKPRP